MGSEDVDLLIEEGEGVEEEDENEDGGNLENSTSRNSK